MGNYVAYHVHTEDSLLDSCTNHKLYTDKAVELGQTAIGFSEHGNCYHWIEKKMYANEHNLKFLIECEVYLTASLDEKVRDNYHTILIAKNEEGKNELFSLIDLSSQEDHFYYKPRITFDEFLNISDNIIKISACLASPLNKYKEIENFDKNIYLKLLKKYNYLEVQPHINSDEQIKYNKLLAKASKKYGIPLIAGTDTHSINQYKAECREILQVAKKITFSSEDEFDLTYKSYDELVEMFKLQGALTEEEYLTAIENTNVMAASVEDFELDTSFKYPILCDDEEEELKKRINDMYHDKLKRGIIKPDIRYKQMVQEELRVFKKIGMVGFMLFMSKLICWCWENNIPVGFCRGSVGGSMIAYLTDIIDVNPLTWGTMFSRFANEDRKEIGDIDVDISPSQRHLVYKHIIDEYGIDKTAYVLAIGTISDKGTIDDIGRALATLWKDNNKKYQDICNKVNSDYQNDYNPYSLDNVKEIKNIYDEDPDKAKGLYPELFYYFDGLRGTAVSQSMHPAGIVVSPITLPNNYGTFWNENKRILSIDMEEIHEVSLVKYDILGLKNIEIIKDCCELAGIPYPKSHEMNWEDEDVWNHIADSPVGIFQFESKFAFDSLKKMGCHYINDLSLVNASIRPSGESYRDRLLAGETNHNPSELIDSLLAKNHGFLTFQEDVIAFLQQVCGLSGSEADNVRRAIGRKQMDRLQAALPQILEGYCSKSDKPREIAEEEAKAFLKIIEDSSNYMFGYNHSTGYSMIGYVCAYLRYHYPCEFITAYLNNANNEDDINMGTELAKTMNIKIDSIRFRHSISNYSCDPKKKIIYKGLTSIKFMNDKVANELYNLRDKTFGNFLELLVDIMSTSCNSRQLQILIELGFFEEFGHPNMLLKQYELFNKFYGKKQIKKDNIEEYPLWVFEKHAIKETEKQFRFENTLPMLIELCETIDYPKTTTKNRIQSELLHLGYIQTIIEDLSDEYYYVTGISGNWLTLYQLNSGDTKKLKSRKKYLQDTDIDVGKIIKILDISQEPKWRKDSMGEWYRDEETEPILTRFLVLK